jgi:magnesium transporter
MAKARKQKKPDHLKRVLAALEAGDTAPVRGILAELHPADIAHILEGLPEPRHRSQVDNQHMGDSAAEAVRGDLVKLMDDKALVAAAHALDTDDIADLIPDLSDEVIAEILFALDKQDRQRLDAVLSYAEDTAGGLMNVDTITVRENIA